MKFSEQQKQRYSNHINLPEIGEEGQQRILNAKILCVGAGGLGSAVLYYLAAAGVGTLGIIDMDPLEMTNLQRQIIHRTPDIGKPKTEIAKKKISQLNPDIEVNIYSEKLTSENIFRILDQYDAVVDGSDNFPTRFLMNDACYFKKRPLFYGSIFRFEGQASTFTFDEETPCYRCLYPEPPPPGFVPSCQQAGVFGVTPGTIAVIQATECLKYILGIGNLLVGRLILFNSLKMEFNEVRIRKNRSCALCGENPTVTQLIDYEEFCALR